MLQQYGRDTVIEINLDAFKGNIQAFQNYLPRETKIMIAVKANAYGHGIIPIAQEAVRVGVHYLGVALVDEGIQLRNAGIEIPILILGYTPPHAIQDAIENGLTITVFSREQGVEISAIAEQHKLKATIHLKIDTGMGRIGVQPEEAVPLLRTLTQLPGLYIEGVYTHLATADDQDTEYLHQQQKTFQQVIDQLKENEITIPLIHIANSPGSIQIPDSVYNMVRLGISAYGYYPSEEMKERITLQPLLSLKSKIVHLKKPVAGAGISYGATYHTTGEQWIATVPVGYGDGFSRSFSNRGEVLVSGKRVPIVGRICMDQFMIDVTNVMPVAVGDEVTIYGRQAESEISVDEVAQRLNTITYEVTTMLSHRLPRLYTRNNQVVEVLNPIRNQR